MHVDLYTDELGGRGVWRCDELEGVLRHLDRYVPVMGTEAGTRVSFPFA